MLVCPPHLYLLYPQFPNLPPLPQHISLQMRPVVLKFFGWVIIHHTGDYLRVPRIKPAAKIMKLYSASTLWQEIKNHLIHEKTVSLMKISLFLNKWVSGFLRQQNLAVCPAKVIFLSPINM